MQLIKRNAQQSIKLQTNFKNILIGTCFLVFSGLVNAQEAKVPCIKKNGDVGLNGLKEFDCNFANAVVNDSKIKKDFKDKINKKLGDKLFAKTSQRLEEIAQIDRYYDQLGLDLSDTSPEVSQQCKLEKISRPKCNLDEKKLNYLSSKFPKLNPKNFSNINNPLLAGMISLTENIRNTKLGDVNKCPANGQVGYFQINSQLIEDVAENFIFALKKNDTFKINYFYNQFPQFKILKDLETLGPDGKKFYDGFVNEMIIGPSAGESKKDFLENFLKRKSTQENIGKVLSKKCQVFAENVEEYLCRDFDHLGMSEEFASEFFKEDDADLDKVVAKSYSCKMDDKAKVDEGFFSRGKTVESKNNIFEADMRTPADEMDVDKNITKFCSIYQCKDIRFKQTTSCQNGGPIARKDFEEFCTQKAKNCSVDDTQYLSFLKSLEVEDKKIKDSQIASNYQSSSSEQAPKKGFSNFYQNLMGVEGTLLSEKKQITPITIAEKKAEFADKKIEAGPTSQMLTQKDFAKTEGRGDDRLVARQEGAEYVPTAPEQARESDPYRRTFNTTQFAKNDMSSSSSSATKVKRQDFSDAESRQTEEMKKLRTELADAIAKVKGTEEEKLATVTDSNVMAMAPKAFAKETTKRMSTAEKDRLDDYRENLNNWENRLRTWQGQLSDRDARANSGGGSSSSPSSIADNRNNFDANSAPTEGYGAANGANGAKLSKVAAVSGAGAKGDGTAERTPGTEKGEGEAGVLSSDKLATLQAENLKTLGIVASDSFIIKVRHQDKIYSIPVKTFNHDGKSMFVPLLNDNNRELSKIVFESPLFKDYKKYQMDRQAKLGTN